MVIMAAAAVVVVVADILIVAYIYDWRRSSIRSDITSAVGPAYLAKPSCISALINCCLLWFSVDLAVVSRWSVAAVKYSTFVCLC